MEKKKIIKISIIIIFIITIIILASLYITNASFRYTVDRFFNKEISEENLISIEIDADSNPNVYAYDEYITVLSKGVLKLYDKNADIVSTIDVNVSTPRMDSNGKYLVIAEDKGKNFFVIAEKSLAWQGSVEGSISSININPNGFVSVIVTNTTYKSVVIVFDPNGVELFRMYLSSTYALCSDISNNNRYLAIGEVDYSGTVIKSKVKIVSIELAKTKSNESIVNSYESESGEIITNLNYQIGDNVYCMFSNYIQKISHNGNERVFDFDKNMLFVDMYMKNNIVIFEKTSSGLFSNEYQVRILNLSTKKENLYFQDLSLIKSLKTSSENIVLNFVNAVQILTKNGRLIKNYTSSKEIKTIVVADKITGIVYKDKIEIIEL